MFGPRAVAVVLSGYGRDATDGVQAIKQHGGLVLAQDEQTSGVFDMPRSAIATGSVDAVLPLEQILPAIVSYLKSGNRPQVRHAQVPG